MEKLKKSNEIEIKIDFETIKYDKKTAQKILQKLARIRKYADFFKKSIKVECPLKNVEHLHCVKNQYEFEIGVAILAVQMGHKKERYDFLYDEICYYLDHVCSTQNLCDFKNNKCFAKQNTNTTMGCCHHFPDKKWGMLYQKELVPCEFLSQNGCTTKSIGCKMFMCDEVRKKGYGFTVYNILLIRYFFNFIQKLIIKTSVFEPKEAIMKRLLKFDF